MTTEPASPSSEDLPEGVASRIITWEGVIEYRDAQGRRHNPVGPAVVHPDRGTFWLITGRDPDEVRADWWFGYWAWWWHGHLHRANGPAVKWGNGKVEYRFNGQKTTITALTRKTG